MYLPDGPEDVIGGSLSGGFGSDGGGGSSGSSINLAVGHSYIFKLGQQIYT
jgi:hypothetical protein